MLNKYRHVEDCRDSDGHASWQCLKCRAQFSAPSLYGWKFCPLCGTQWDGEMQWEKERHYPREAVNPYAMVIQDRIVYRCRDGDSVRDWKDTYRSLKKWQWGREMTVKEFLEMWQNEVGLAQGDANEERKSHEAYCKHSGKSEPFSPFSITQLRMVLRKEGQPDKVVFEYLPTHQQKENCAHAEQT